MKRTIGFKMTTLFVLFALILVLALGVFSYLNSWESFSRMYWDDARNAANTAAAFIDGNRIAGYVQSGEKDAYYHELQQTLNLLKKELGVMYLYVYAPGSDSFTYIMEARLSTDDPDKISDLGDVFEYGHSEYEYLLPDVLAKRGSSQVVVLENEYYGHSVSAWAPVFDDGGELSAMVEAEIPLDLVEENLASFIWVLMALACFVIAVLVVMLYLLMRRMISKPLKKLR